MTDAAFLGAIIAEPGEDCHRLVYADWLEEHGQEARSEFVRAQVELAAFSPRSAAVLYHGQQARKGEACETPGCDFCALRRRERELWEEHWRDFGSEALPGGDVGGWNQTIAYGVFIRWRGVDLTRCLFRRGFVASASLTLADFYGTSGEGCGPRLVLAAPLEAVRLTDREPLAQYGRWWWEESNYGPLPRGLPTEIFMRMRPPSKARGPGGGVFALPNAAPFDSEAGALAAASAACLAWARADEGGRAPC